MEHLSFLKRIKVVIKCTVTGQCKGSLSCKGKKKTKHKKGFLQDFQVVAMLFKRTLIIFVSEFMADTFPFGLFLSNVNARYGVFFSVKLLGPFW